MSDQPLPAVPYLKIPENGDPYLEAYKCGSCGATFLGERQNCSKCGSRDQMTTVKLPKPVSYIPIPSCTDPFQALKCLMLALSLT